MKQIIITADSQDTLITELESWLDYLGAPRKADAAPTAPKATRTRKAAESKIETAPPTTAVSVDELRGAIQNAIKAHGEPPVKEVFTKHKAKKFSDIKPAQFEAVLADITLLDELAGGGSDSLDLD